MRLMRDLRERVHTAGTWSRDLLSTFRKLRDAIRSIDRERIPDPKSAIRALKRSVRFVVSAGLDELKKLQEAIQDLQNAIDSIRTRVAKSAKCFWFYSRMVERSVDDLSTCKEMAGK